MEVTTKIKTFEDACKILELEPDSVIPDFSSYPKRDQKAQIAHSKLMIIVRAANKVDNNGQEWQPDWNNHDQWKYFPWFEMGGSSSGFRFDDYDDWNSYSSVGSRLCFKSREVCEEIAEQFIEIYQDYYLIN